MKKISKRTRSMAARLCEITASNMVMVIDGQPGEFLIHYGLDHLARWCWADPSQRERAIDLALDAWQHARLECVWGGTEDALIEGAAMLSTGWSPP